MFSLQGENGGENYIGKIIEFFKTKDDKNYFRVQWFFRATDTVSNSHCFHFDLLKVI